MQIKPADQCQFDIVGMGEVMLRLDPGAGRVRTARQFDVWEGGGEYNVARGLSRCFGKRAGLVSALVDNEVGRLLQGLIVAGGVDMSHVRWQDFDGMGRNARNGLNFTERGFGVRGALGTSDRGHSAASQLQPGDIDWDQLFGSQGVRWFHTGGIFAALSKSTPEVIIEALTAARQHGTITSYDLNYRHSLWEQSGGSATCQEVNRRIAPLVDVMFGNEEDFTACLGLPVPGTDEQLAALPREGFRKMIGRAAGEFPNLQLVATTLRTVHSATINDWSALCWHQGQIHESGQRIGLEIFDRVGGGDSFAAGLIYGLLESLEVPLALEYGAAHGALAMTTPGDTSMASLDQVRALVDGASPRIRR